MASQQDPLQTGEWTHGLCGCFDNLGVCIITYFVPCVTFGMTREKLYGDGCVLYGCLYTIPIVNCVMETQQRGEIRQRRAIPGGGFADCCLVTWCPLCTLAQEEQEAMALQAQQAAMGGNTVILPGNAVIIAGQAPPPAYQAGAAPPQYGQQPYPGQQYPAQPYPGQQGPAQPYQGQQYPAQPYEVKGQDEMNRE